MFVVSQLSARSTDSVFLHDIHHSGEFVHSYGSLKVVCRLVRHDPDDCDRVSPYRGAEPYERSKLSRLNWTGVSRRQCFDLLACNFCGSAESYGFR